MGKLSFIGCVFITWMYKYIYMERENYRYYLLVITSVSHVLLNINYKLPSVLDSYTVVK